MAQTILIPVPPAGFSLEVRQDEAETDSPYRIFWTISADKRGAVDYGRAISPEEASADIAQAIAKLAA